MSAKKQAINQGRRKFLRGSALAGAGAAVTSVFPGAAVDAADTNQAGQIVEAPVEEGYRLTKHIKDYYKSAAS